LNHYWASKTILGLGISFHPSMASAPPRFQVAKEESAKAERRQRRAKTMDPEAKGPVICVKARKVQAGNARIPR
jgi:hypothetical protein